MSYSKHSRKSSRKAKTTSNPFSSLFKSVTRESARSSALSSALTEGSRLSRETISTTATSTHATLSTPDSFQPKFPSVTNPSKERLDVFAFLENDEEESESLQAPTVTTLKEPEYHTRTTLVTTDSSALTRAPVQTDHPIRTVSTDYRKPSTNFHSDTSISDCPTTLEKKTTSGRDESWASDYPAPGSPICNDRGRNAYEKSPPSSPDHSADLDAFPEAYYSRESWDNPYNTSRGRDTRLIATPISSKDSHPPALPFSHHVVGLPRNLIDQTSSGQADPHDRESLPPVHRRFKSLNSWLLLQLQTEISSLESELLALNNAISTAEESSAHLGLLRNQEVILPIDQLRWRRTGICNNISAKLDIYYRKLASYNQIARAAPVSSTDMDAYSPILKANRFSSPVADASKTIPDLRDLEDMARITADNTSLGRLVNPWLNSRPSALATGFIVLTTAVAFQLMPSFFLRFSLGAIVLIAMVAFGLLPTLGDDHLSATHARAATYFAAVLIITIITG